MQLEGEKRESLRGRGEAEDKKEDNELMTKTPP